MLLSVFGRRFSWKGMLDVKSDISFTRFIGHGRQVRGGVTQWDAHSHITRIICEYCKGIARVHGETHHWVLIKNELFKHMALYGKEFTYIELYAFVMPSLLAHRQSSWAERHLLHPSSAGVHEVSGRERERT